MDQLPHGLRYVLIHVTLGSKFPPAANSVTDIALLRAAYCARQRKARGSDDDFLFVVVGQQAPEVVSETITAYGFPKAEVVCIEAEDVERRLELGEEIIHGLVGKTVEGWMNLEHSGAVAVFPKEYADTEFWWSGVERYDHVFDWPFDDGEFAKALPISHFSKAATWLTVVGHAVDLYEVQGCGPAALGRDIAAAWAATLCEWLHGFEAASGNGYNHFESEYSAGLMPSDFYLGFELARLSRDDLESACESSDADIDEMQIVALKVITQDKRDDLRAALSDFFGGDTGLYWALHSAIWPSYSDDYPRSMRDAMDRELGSGDMEDMARLDAPWRYVTEG